MKLVAAGGNYGFAPHDADYVYYETVPDLIKGIHPRRTEEQLNKLGEDGKLTYDTLQYNNFGEIKALHVFQLVYYKEDVSKKFVMKKLLKHSIMLNVGKNEGSFHIDTFSDLH